MCGPNYFRYRWDKWICGCSNFVSFFSSLSEPSGILSLACLKTRTMVLVKTRTMVSRKMEDGQNPVCFLVKDFSTGIHSQFIPSLFKGLQL